MDILLTLSKESKHYLEGFDVTFFTLLKGGMDFTCYEETSKDFTHIFSLTDTGPYLIQLKF